MTEYDRGAYTPQPDAPLQFDARGPRGRKPMPMTLIGSGAVLIVLLGALALHYRHDTKPAPAETVHPTSETVAQAPLPAAAPAKAVAAATPVKESDGSINVFSGPKPDAKAPVFAAGPEAPKARGELKVVAAEPLVAKSAPIATTNTSTPAPVALAKAAPLKAAPAGTAKTASHPATGYIAPSLASIAKPSATNAVEKLAAAPVAKPGATARVSTTAAVAKPVATTLAATASAKGAAPTAAKPLSGGAAVVQIGAFSSTAQSDKGWADVSSAMASAMAGKSKRVELLDKGGKTLYRTSVAGFASRSAADAFCKALAAKGHICFAKS